MAACLLGGILLHKFLLKFIAALQKCDGVLGGQMILRFIQEHFLPRSELSAHWHTCTLRLLKERVRLKNLLSEEQAAKEPGEKAQV